MLSFLKKYRETIVWASALVLLFFMDPGGHSGSLCILKNIGVNWCPGCGLGHAIHYALHLNFTQSVQEHILGIPATVIIMYQTIKSFYITHKTIQYEP
ncbi:MAG: DUF2752 domain-containing protein [Niabella sp.]